MALNTIPYPVAIDFDIQQNLQIPLYNKLIALWNIGNANTYTYNSFGRVYRNFDKARNGYIPQFYSPTANNNTGGYVGSNEANGGAIFFEDTPDPASGVAAVSFIGLLGTKHKHKIDAGDWAQLEILFFVNLQKITAGGIPIANQQGQRMDELCFNDVLNALKTRGGSTLEVISSERDINKVLSNYSGEIKDGVMKMDMQPRFCFKIICDLAYNSLLNTKPVIYPS